VFSGHANRADGNGRHAGYGLCPRGQIAIGAEFTLPIAALRAVKDVDASVDERARELLQLGRGREVFGDKVLNLPLRDAQGDRQFRPYGASHRGDCLYAEPDTIAHRTAIGVGATIGTESSHDALYPGFPELS
jgi:hypothetical protein